MFLRLKKDEKKRRKNKWIKDRKKTIFWHKKDKKGYKKRRKYEEKNENVDDTDAFENRDLNCSRTRKELN